jgi:acetate kinase
VNVLVINAGSSSLKYELLRAEDDKILARGLCERVGDKGSFHKHFSEDGERVIKVPMKDHREAVKQVLATLLEDAPIDSLDEIQAVGHRVVHGGEYFNKSVLIDDDVIAKIDELSELAPLHNPGALMGIRACMELMPDIPHVAVFDTAFFQTIPPRAYMYALPYEYYEKYRMRKYGAHGTSHRYIALRAAEIMGRPLKDLKLITCHLGNGCSVTAIDHGHAVDTSMGFTPLDGLMMGTRCGSIDPACVTFLMEKEGYTPQEMDDIMNRKSGLLGVSGVSNDLREVLEATEHGNERAILAYEMYSYSVKKYIGQYITLMAGVDAVVLTAGVGEHSVHMRRMIFAGLEPLGIIIDHKKNRSSSVEQIISDDRSTVKIIIIPTNEEAMIAQDVYDIVSGKGISSES